MDLLFSLPVLLAAGLFIGVVVLIRLLLSPEKHVERRSCSDRRSGAPMPELPFYDCNQVKVLADRRCASRPDRRCQVFVLRIEPNRN